MTKNFFLKAVLDGAIWWVILFCITYFTLFQWVWISPYFLLVIPFAGAVFSTAVSVILARKGLYENTVMLFPLISFLCFVVCVTTEIAVHVICGFGFSPSRELNVADGLVLILVDGRFIWYTVLLKVITFVVLAIIKWRKGKQRAS